MSEPEMSGPESLSVVVVGRGSLLSEGVALLLERSGYKVDCEVSPYDALKPSAAGKSLIVVMEEDKTEVGVADQVRDLRAAYPRSCIVVLYSPDTTKNLAGILCLGADGCLPVSIGSEGMIAALKLIVAESVQFVVIDPKCASIMTDKNAMSFNAASLHVQPSKEIIEPPDHLAASTRATDIAGISDREHAVLQNLIRGDSNKVIARRLDISESTVKIHVRSLLRKLGAENRTQAAICVLSDGFKDLQSMSPIFKN